MKKLLLSTIVVWFTLGTLNVHAYDFTKEDERIVENATTKIEKVILQKWKTYRMKYLSALDRYRLKYKSNERLSAVILATMARIRTTWEKAAEPTIAELFPFNTGSGAITETKATSGSITASGSMEKQESKTSDSSVVEVYKKDPYYPIILSMKDDKKNILKRSEKNGFSRQDGLYTGFRTSTSLKLGDTVTLTVEAEDPKWRALSYNWNSNSPTFNARYGLDNGKFRYVANNTLSFTLDSAMYTEIGDSLRIVVQIRSDKESLRMPWSECDDTIFMDYTIVR